MSIAETVIQKLSALPPEKQEQVLQYVEALTDQRELPVPRQSGSALRSFAQLKLDGAIDSSTRFHEYLYGKNARDRE